MGRTTGSKDLELPKRGALIELYNTSYISKAQLAKKYNCDRKTVRNILKRVENAEKENLDLLSSEAHQRRPSLGRPPIINDRQQRSLIRYATKNRF